MPAITPADTGNGATLTLSVTGGVGNIRKIGSLEHERSKIQVSHLGTTDFHEYIAGDLDEPGEFEVEVEFDRTNGLPARGVVETVTITYPQHADEAGAANHAGTGFITKVGTPELVNNEVQILKLTIAFDGGTGPTFTAAT